MTDWWGLVRARLSRGLCFVFLVKWYENKFGSFVALGGEGFPEARKRWLLNR